MIRLLPRHPATLAALAVVGVHFGLVLWWIFTSFAVVDEVGHLGSGLANWRTFNMRPYCVNPPLPRMIATLPIWAADPNLSLAIDETPGTRCEWQLGVSLSRDNPDRYVSLVCQARLANLVWAVLAIGVLWRWSGELYGPWGRLIAVSLWCLDPTVIAFSGVVVPDVAAAASGLLVCYLFWRYLRAPGWYAAGLVGLAFGLTLLTKTTWLVLSIVWPVLIGLARWGGRMGARSASKGNPAASLACAAGSPMAAASLACAAGSPMAAASLACAAGSNTAAGSPTDAAAQSSRPRFRHLPLMAVVGWFVLCAGYGFDKFGRPLGDFRFISHALAGPDSHPGDASAQPKPGNRFHDSSLAKLPVPLPADLIVGIDVQKYDFERHFPSYLNGKWRDHGWWYYYLYAMALKLALPTLILMLAGVFWCLFAPRSPDRLDEWAFLLPAFAVIAFVSSQTGFNHHMRYVLPVFPLLFLAAGRLAKWDKFPTCPTLEGTSWKLIPLRLDKFPTCPTLEGTSWKLILLRGVVAALLIWCASATASVAPHFMSYFNPLAGGPDNGWRHLVDSNIDWGQDLLYLRKWLDEHPEARPLGVRYYNLIQPKDAGIDAVQLPAEPTPGYYAVGVNHVAGSTFPGRANLQPGAVGPYAYFQRFAPIAKAGYSIFIYHITPEEANRVRAEMGLPPWTAASQ